MDAQFYHSPLLQTRTIERMDTQFYYSQSSVTIERMNALLSFVICEVQFYRPLLQVGENRRDGWMPSFTIVLYYKWEKIGEMDGCPVLLVLYYKWVKIAEMDRCPVLL